VPTITSRVPALIDYLVALFTNAATLGAAPAPGTVTVYDGPATTGLDAPLKLFVGLSDPDNPAAEAAADSVQSWSGAIGRLGRDETITVHCCAEAWAGTDDLKTVRVAVTGITAAVEVLMQADTTQFGGNVLYPAPGIAALALLQNNTQQGAVARMAFDLVFRARIGG
jgi:hypothetical protein